MGERRVRFGELRWARWPYRAAAFGLMLLAAQACATLKGIEEANPIPDRCNNGDQDGDETSTDCGGSCKRCEVCRGCNEGKDCQTGLCFAGRCRPPAVGSMSFDPTVYSLKHEPVAVALADVPDPASDGGASVARTEMVVANAGTRDLRRYRVEDGQVEPSRPAAEGELPVAVVAADFDANEYPDFAVANPEKDQVSVLFMEDDGSMSDPQAVPAGSKPVAVATGDLNGDSVPDLVAANSGDGTLTVLLSNGDRSFARTQVPGAATKPVALALANFGGSDALDVAVVDGTDNVVGIMIGDGSGGLAAPTTVAVGTGPTSVAAADFDGDQKIDLAVTNLGAGTVSLLPGNGDGTFGAEQVLTPSSAPHWVAAGQFDADGKADLAVALEGGGVAVLPGGSANFTDLPAGSRSVFVTTGDVDQDGDADLMVANDSDNTVSLLLGKGDGTFEPATHHGPGAGVARLKRVGLLNYEEIGVLSKTTGTVSVLLRNDQHEYRRIASLTAGAGTSAFALGDFDYDDAADLFTADGANDKVRIWHGHDDGTFTAGDEYGVGVGPIDVQVGRLRDTNEHWVSDDLLTLNQTSNDIQVRLNENDGTFGNANQFAAGTKPVAWTFADLNHSDSSRPDLVIANADSNDVTVLLHSDDFLFEPAGNFSAGSAPSAVATGDFNGDGNRDVVVSSGTGGNISVLLGNGDGTLQSDVAFPAGDTPVAVVTHDFNLDTIWDVAVVNQSAGTVSILLGNGDGSFQPPTTVQVGAGPIDLTVLDSNEDCAPDLAVGNGGDDSVHLLVNITGG